MEKARALAPDLERVVYWGDGSADALEALMQQAGLRATSPPATPPADDVCLIGFTSGTTGEPKGTMHFHRDMLATCDSYGRHVLRASADDRFIGSPPLAFTFGLGGLVLFPLRVGASTMLLEKAAPDDLLAAIAQVQAPRSASPRRPPIAPCWPSSPSTTSRRCANACRPARRCPRRRSMPGTQATGIKIIDGIGATEMLHIFIGSPEDEIRAGATGRPVPGYEASVIDDDGREVPPGTVGRLAVRGPTGCRYLADTRQRNYVQRRLERHRRHLPDG